MKNLPNHSTLFGNMHARGWGEDLTQRIQRAPRQNCMLQSCSLGVRVSIWCGTEDIDRHAEWLRLRTSGRVRVPEERPLGKV